MYHDATQLGDLRCSVIMGANMRAECAREAAKEVVWKTTEAWSLRIESYGGPPDGPKSLATGYVQGDLPLRAEARRGHV